MKKRYNAEKSTKSVKLKWVLPDKPQMIFLASILVLCAMILVNELLDFPDLIRGAKTNPIDWYKFATEMSAIMLVTLSGSVLLRKTESKRQRAEDEIKTLKQQMEFILGVTKTGLDIIDSEFNIRYIDPEWQKMYGDPTGIKCHDYFMGRSEVCPGCGIVKALETKKIAITEEILIKEDNRPIQVTTIPYQDEWGEWLVAEVNVDITERKKLEEALRGSEWEKGIILDSMSEMVMYQDREQRIVWANRAACEWYGLAPDQLKGRHCYELRYNKTESCPNCPVLEAFRTGQPQENEILAPNGRILYVRSYPARDERGKVVGGVEVALDITERKQVESALSLSEQRLKKAQAIAHIGNWEWNIKENTLSWSDELYRIFGVDRGTFVLSYESIENLILTDDRDMNNRQVKKLLEGAASGEYYFRVVRPDGEIRYLNQIFEVVRDQKGTAFRAFGTIQDITERKQAEEALKESEEKYRALIEAAGRAGEGIIIIQDRGEGEVVFVFVNDQFCKMSGYSQAELVGRSPWDLVPREISIQLKDWYKRRHMGESLPSHYEAAGVCKDGTIMPLELSIVTMPWQGKIATVLYLRDITERKQAEEALRESEGRFRQLAENIDQVFWLTDWENDKLLYVNPSYEKMFGRSCQSAYQDRLSWYQVIHPDDRDRVRELLVKNAQMGQNTEVEYRIIRDDGEVRWILDRNYPIRNQDDKVYRIVSIGEDITERKRAEEALRISEDKFSKAFHASPDVLVISRRSDGAIIETNDQWDQLFGYERKETIGRSSLDMGLFVNSEDRQRAITRLKEQGFVRDFEMDVQSKSGETRQVVLSVEPIEINSDPCMLTIIHDITERKQAVEALQKSQAKLQSIFSAAPAGIGMTIDQTIQELNARLCEISGYSKEELLGKSISMVYPSDQDFFSTKDEIYEQLREKGHCSIETSWKRKDGRLIYVLLNCAQIQAGDFSQGITFTVLDITERKRVEEALRESEHKYRTLFEESFDGLFITSPGGRILDMNKKGVMMFGYNTKEEILALDLERDVYANPPDRKRILAMVNAHGTAEYEVIVKKKNGEKMVTHCSLTAVKDEKGEITTYRGIIRDITERKRAEELLRTSEAQLSNAMKIAHLGYWEYDVANDRFTFNDQFYSIFHAKAEDVGGYVMSSARYAELFVHPDDMSLVGIEIQKAFETTDPDYSRQLEHRIIYADGGIGYITVRFFIVKDDHGRTVKTYGANQDITERKQAERAIRESEEKYRSVVENIGIGVSLISPNMEILTLNHQMKKWFPHIDISKRPICYQAFNNPPREKECSYCPTYKTLQDGLVHESITETPSGNKIINYRVVSSPIKDKSGKIIAAIEMVEDITERKHAEEALQKSQAKLKSIFSTAPAGIGMTINQTIQELNVRLCEISGYSKEELLGKSISMVYPSDQDFCFTKDEIYKQLREKEHCSIETSWKRKEGVLIYVLLNCALLKPGDFSQGITFTVLDITERKQAEEELQRTHFAIDSAPEGFAWIDKNFHYTYVNEGMCRLLGYTQDELLFLKPSDLDLMFPQMPPSELWVEMRGIKSQVREGLFRRKDNTTFPAELTIDHVVFRGEEYIFSIMRDITERKRAEGAMRLERDRLEEVTRNMGAGLAIISKDYRTIWANQVLIEIFGEVEGKICYSTYNQRSQVCPGCGVREVFETGKDKVVSEQVGKDKDGNTIWSQIVATPIRDQNGNVTAALELVVPITERKQAEEELRVSEEKHRLVFDNIPVFLAAIDQTGKFVVWNRYAENMLGYTPQEAIEKLIPLDIHETKEDADEVIRVASESGIYDKEIRFRRKDKTFVTVHLAVVPDKDSTGKIVGFYGFAEDITERKRVEQELKDSSARFSTIFHSSPISIAITRLQDSRFVDVNEAWQRITGYTREEAIGRTPIELGNWVDPAQRNQLIRQLQKGGVVRDFEFKTRHRSGTISDMLLTADLITLGGESYMLSLAHDITEKKKMEAQLIQSERMGAVGTLAYGIAHEFNNILAGILGNAEFGLISRKRGEVTECLRIIMENCDRAKSITNNLLAFSTHRTVRKEVAGVADAVESVLSLVEREMEKRNIKVARKIDAVPNIYCDIGELSQVVLNMVTNARDAMTPKGGTLTVEICKKKDDIEMIFSDTGCGIPDSIKSRIFEPFVTTKGALGQSEIPGTGLGLFLSYGIISRYGGKIEVESKVGKGSRFTVTIPISINQTPSDFPAEEERALFVPENLNILLVDDEKPILNSIQNFLETKGHSVVTTTSGKKGLRLFKDKTFDLVLSDITMPDINGLELISKLKIINGKVKLIAITGHLEEEKLESAREAGADKILIKPFKNEDLYKAIGEVFAI